jgi:Domain of unknown function (DUF4159)
VTLGKSIQIRLFSLAIVLWGVALPSFAQPLMTADSRAALAAPPEAEFHMGRLIYASSASDGFRRGGRPWWAIDYPEAEYHFMSGLRRLTRLDVADDSRHMRATAPRLFDYPFLLVQQVGHWSLSEEEAAALRAYLLRGGFLMVDDFHGLRDWQVFEEVIRHVLPDYPIVDLRGDEDIMHILYQLDQGTQIPGRRHLYRSADGSIQAQMQGPATWRAIYDDRGHMMVAINFNMDMGDAWEHADDPIYPEPMTALAYRFGVNYVLYTMTN